MAARLCGQISPVSASIISCSNLETGEIDGRIVLDRIQTLGLLDKVVEADANSREGAFDMIPLGAVCTQHLQAFEE